MSSDRLSQQLDFIVEIDKLKKIIRRSPLTDNSRFENSAEHSWHLAIMAILLNEHAKEQVDISKVIKMVLIHDIVEIDAGDTYCYDEQAHHDKEEREQKAADRLFTLLPQEQAEEFRKVWDEFELRKSAEARFAAALDRLQPLLLNYHSGGTSWKDHNITKQQVIQRNSPIKDSSSKLWTYAAQLIDDAAEKGFTK